MLIISPTFPFPVTTGNRARIYKLLLDLKELGHDIYFLYINTEPFDQTQAEENGWTKKTFVAPYTPPHKTLFKRSLRKLKRILRLESGFLYSIDDWYDHSLDSYVLRLFEQIQFDVVIVEYVFFSKVLNCLNSDVLKLIDTHDIYTNRHRIYLENQQTPHWYSTTAAEEAKGLNRADIIVAIQPKEKAYFSTLTNKKVVVVGHTVTLAKSDRHLSTNKTILFFGANNPMNVQGINTFIQDAFPQIQHHFPQVELLLAGAICDAIEEHDHYTKLGRVENLKVVYDLADVVINPITFGTGLKIKTVEALGYGKPVVTTSIGAAGLETGINQAFLVADELIEFAQAIIRVLSDDALYENLSQNAYDFAQQWNQTNLQELANLLKPG